jgi:hypothetical protein
MLQCYKILLSEIGAGRMNNNAYDTAWVARLGELDYTLSNNALDWICGHQLPDGSWGTESPFYYHDRMICTLAAITALTIRGRRAHDRVQIERGLEALERMTLGATMGLHSMCGYAGGFIGPLGVGLALDLAGDERTEMGHHARGREVPAQQLVPLVGRILDELGGQEPQRRPQRPLRQRRAPTLLW